MHPLLHNFSLQAGGSHYPTINPAMQEAFAEMIVRECMRLADDEASRFLNMGETDLSLAMLNYQEMIRQHFGLTNGRETSS